MLGSASQPNGIARKGGLQVDRATYLIDCEKQHYIRFVDMLQMRPGGIVVADNLVSPHLTEYAAARPSPVVEPNR